MLKQIVLYELKWLLFIVFLFFKRSVCKTLNDVRYLGIKVRLFPLFVI